MASRHQMALSVAAVGLLLTASLVHGSGQQETRPDDGGRIVGGENATIEEFPWLVVVETGLLFLTQHCGGSVLSERWVLTAAHCFQPLSTIVRSSTSTWNKGGLEHLVRNAITHELYRPEGDITVDYDIAVLEMETPFIWTKQLQPVRGLATENPPAGTTVVLAGWGYINTDGKEPETLQKLSLVIQDWNECKRIIDSVIPGTVNKRKICASPETNRGPCHGDSGGPLIDKESGVQVGFTSSIVKDCADGFPTVYMSVAAMRDWIREKTGV